MNIFDKFENDNSIHNPQSPNSSIGHQDIIHPDEEDSFLSFTGGLTSPWITAANFTTQYTNAHVAVCVGALGDAVSQLPADIIRSETSNGAKVEIDDNAHPANFMFRGPNPDMTWSDFMQGTVTSLLIDGNVYTVINRTPIGYELFLLDPTKVEIIYSDDRSQIEGYEYTVDAHTQMFPRDEVIHMRNFDVRNPLKGKSLLESLVKELTMDKAIMDFNAVFFKNGATIGTMFIPERNLNPAQHKQIQKAIRASTQGTTKSFGLFVNKYPGKMEFPGQKHKDIAFLELLKYIRETINSVFKVPPVKAGILEFANYANAVQQMESFWTDAVAPILRRIQDIINKDFIWKYYDTDHELKFDTSGIAAIQGDLKQRMEILTGYKKEGILTIDECREELGKEPLEEGAVETSAEEDKYTHVYDTFVQRLRKSVIDKLTKKTSGLTTVLPYVTVEDIFDVDEENELLQKMLQPYIKDTFMKAGEIISISTGATIFDINSDEVKLNLYTINEKHTVVIDRIYNILEHLLSTAVEDKQGLKELTNRIKDKLSWNYAVEWAKEIVPNIARRASRIAENQKLMIEAQELTENK